MSIAGHVGHGDFAFVVKPGLDDADGCFNAVIAGLDFAHMSECGHESDQSVAAHAQIADVVKEDDARGAARISRGAKQSADHHIGPARLVDNGGAEGVEVSTKAVSSLSQAAGAQIGTARDHHARRLSRRVRINDLNALEVNHSRWLTAYFAGRVLIACRMTPRISSRSFPTRGTLGARTISDPSPVSAMASLMYCTSFGWVSRCKSGVYQR